MCTFYGFVWAKFVLISYTILLQIKCDQYWPNRGSEMYGVMHVSLLDIVELATYTIRTFQISRVNNRELFLWSYIK